MTDWQRNMGHQKLDLDDVKKRIPFFASVFNDPRELLNELVAEIERLVTEIERLREVCGDAAKMIDAVDFAGGGAARDLLLKEAP